MISALFYLQYHTFKNRLIFRFKRLKQPKYLIGAIVGGLYLYFYFFRYLFHLPGAQSPAAFTASPEPRLTLELLGALLLFVIVLLAWLIPHGRAALTFSEAEVAFLFPAPVTRPTLIHFKLARSQLRILFSVLLLTLFSGGIGGNAWIHALGWWLILSTLNLHFLGSSFARTLLLDRGISNRLRRLLVFTAAAVLVAGVWLWARQTMPQSRLANVTDLNSAADYLRRVLNAGPALYLLYPFRLLVRPFLAPDAGSFLQPLIPALLLLALHYLWVIGSDVAFEEASVEASRKMAVRLAAARSGNWQHLEKNQKARRPYFKLAALGQPSTAIVWKNLIGLGHLFSPRLWLSLLIFGTVFAFVFSSNAQVHGILIFLAFAIAIILGYSLLLGPQLLRLDFRQDLPLADVLKTFPLRGWKIALGEVLAPATVLACSQWLLLLIETGLIFFLPGLQKPLLLSIALGSALVLPWLDVLLLVIPNAAVLLFPSWIQTGKDSPRGVEATGQRLIFVLGQMLVLMVALTPAAAAFVPVFLAIKFTAGPAVAVPFACLAAAMVLILEAGLGVLLLGKLFERFDVSQENPN